jgi:hypothetical protein
MWDFLRIYAISLVSLAPPFFLKDRNLGSIRDKPSCLSYLVRLKVQRITFNLQLL